MAVQNHLKSDEAHATHTQNNLPRLSECSSSYLTPIFHRSFVSFLLYSSSTKYIRTRIVVRFQPTTGTAMRLLPTFLVLLVGGASVSFAQAQALTETSSCPSTGYVNCRGGDAYDPITNVPITNGGIPSSCFEACNNGAECCFGTDACTGTTACIEKSSSTPPDADRPCSGVNACENVGNAFSKPIVSSGSCRGDLACSCLAQNGGSVTSIEDSCMVDLHVVDLDLPDDAMMLPVRKQRLESISIIIIYVRVRVYM